MLMRLIIRTLNAALGGIGMAIENVYGDENYKRMKKLLKQRISAKRYDHS